MTKKILAILMALVLTLAMTTVAFADGPAPTPIPDMGTKQFSKTYKSVGSTARSPQETFSFTDIAFVDATDTGVGYTREWAEAEENLPTISTVTYGVGEATSTGTPKSFNVTLPSDYPSVGVYTYSFKEADNNTAGVVYNPTTMLLVVSVIEDTDGQKRVAAIHCEGNSGTKTDAFENTYKAGILQVKKHVTGNLGDKNRDFAMKVTFTAPEGDTVMSDITYNDGTTEDTTIAAGATGWTEKEVTIYVKDNETVTFKNIPAGVTYKVEETDTAVQAVQGETPEYTITVQSGTNGTISETNAAVAEITNNKGADIDTGITMDSIPYIVLLAVVAIGVVAMLLKKRHEA